MAVIEPRTSKRGGSVYRVKIRLKGHKSLSNTFARKTDAKEWAQKTEADLKRGQYFDEQPGKNQTVATCIEDYLKDKYPRLKPHLQRARRLHFAWWNARIGQLPLKAVTAARLNGFKRELEGKLMSNTTTRPLGWDTSSTSTRKPRAT